MKRTITLALIMLGLNNYALASLVLKSDRWDNYSETKKKLFEKRKLVNNKPFGIRTSVFSGSGKEWDETEVTSGGFFLNFGLYFPNSNYFSVQPDSLPAPGNFAMGGAFDFGNYFRIAKMQYGRFSFGLRATWLSISGTGKKSGDDIYLAYQFSALRVGPQFCAAINENMGIDAFYDIGYNYSLVYGDIYSKAKTVTSVGWLRTYAGLTQEIGAAFHFKVFSAGLSYRFGKLKNVSSTFDSVDKPTTDIKSSTNNLRLTLGLRF
ncbi:MAG: hypothetical protein PSX36_07940 [bacterium]|nr:hypothetical protein [bacterium]